MEHDFRMYDPDERVANARAWDAVCDEWWTDRGWRHCGWASKAISAAMATESLLHDLADPDRFADSWASILYKERQRIIEADRKWHASGINAVGGKYVPHRAAYDSPVLEQFYFPSRPLRVGGYEIKWRYAGLPVALEESRDDPAAEYDSDLHDDVLKRVIDGSAVGRGFYTVQPQLFLPVDMTPDQREAQAHREASWERDKIAGEQARALLLENLSEQQREDYLNYGYFYILKVGALEGFGDLPYEKYKLLGYRKNPHLLRIRKYRLHRQYPNGNVKLVHPMTGKAVLHFCLHSHEAFPIDDLLLTQKLLIDSNEIKLWQDANITTPSKNDERDFLAPKDAKKVAV